MYHLVGERQKQGTHTKPQHTRLAGCQQVGESSSIHVTYNRHARQKGAFQKNSAAVRYTEHFSVSRVQINVKFRCFWWYELRSSNITRLHGRSHMLLPAVSQVEDEPQSMGGSSICRVSTSDKEGLCRQDAPLARALASRGACDCCLHLPTPSPWLV